MNEQITREVQEGVALLRGVCIGFGYCLIVALVGCGLSVVW